MTNSILEHQMERVSREALARMQEEQESRARAKLAAMAESIMAKAIELDPLLAAQAPVKNLSFDQDRKFGI